MLCHWTHLPVFPLTSWPLVLRKVTSGAFCPSGSQSWLHGWMDEHCLAKKIYLNFVKWISFLEETSNSLWLFCNCLASPSACFLHKIFINQNQMHFDFCILVAVIWDPTHYHLEVMRSIRVISWHCFDFLGSLRECFEMDVLPTTLWLDASLLIIVVQRSQPTAYTRLDF